MNAAQLPVEETRWPPGVVDGMSWLTPDGRRSVPLPALVGLCAVLVDAILLAGAFMLAYLGRFSIDEAAATLSLDRYVRLAVLEAAFATILMATHGLYELERPQSWWVRLR